MKMIPPERFSKMQKSNFRVSHVTEAVTRLLVENEFTVEETLSVIANIIQMMQEILREDD